MGWEPVECLLYQRLKEINKNPKWLSGRTKITKSRLSDYEHMRVIMNISTAKTISEEIECDMDDLYKWKYVDLNDDK